MWARERCARGGCEKTWSRRDGDVLLNPVVDFSDALVDARDASASARES